MLLHHLVQLATRTDPALETLLVEVVADTEQAAQHAAQAVGFVPVAVFAKHVRYSSGAPHDLLVMALQVGATQDGPALPDPAPSTYTF